MEVQPVVINHFGKKTKIGNHVAIGTNSTILPVEIVDNVVIGAGSVVTKIFLKWELMQEILHED